MFDIKKRDGMARIGIFSNEGVEITLPAAIEPQDIFPDLRKECLTNIPLSADREFTARYFEHPPGQPVPVHPAIHPDAESGACIMVPCWHTAFFNPRNYVNWLIRLKSMVPPDTAWYAPGSALPSRIHILCFSGFDLFDFTAVDLASARNMFCTPEGEFSEELIESGICNCEGCRSGDLRLHNRLALLREIALVSRFIAWSRLRELVETRCRMNSGHVAILRHLDRNYEFMEEKTPIARAVPMGATTGEVLFRAEVRRFADRVCHRYVPPPGDTVVLLPCSARKPYSLSQSHRQLISAIYGRAVELIVTSPLGLVPRELERVYPAAHYDVPVTGHWDREEVAFAAGILNSYFKMHPPGRVIAHLEGGALESARNAADMAGIDLEITCIRHPLTRESLSLLDESLSGEARVTHDTIRGTGTWQFGYEIETSRLSVRGRYPQMMASINRRPQFSLDTGTGLLKPTIEGWTLIPDVYRVKIDDFIPKGDILAPGVTDADPAIRTGDEVLVEGARVLATGRAAMPASEMKSSRRGVAVKVRKIKSV
ncbi:MAG TPA: archaeosine synthase subunit alpha [Methanoregulaceae archaeon]|nr:archaeosine synthase subunit alpha [Methanoregulaceae archaeon]